MKIAMINQAYYPMVSGASIVMQRLAEGMAKRGHSVLVIAASERDQAYQVEEPYLSQVRIRSWKNPFRVGQRFTLNPKKAVLDALEGFAPQIIHSHEPFQMGNAGLEYTRHANIPNVLTIHAIPVSIAAYAPDLPGLRRNIEKLIWSYARRLTSRFTCTVAPTQSVADIVFKRLGIKPQVISNGVDLHQFHPNCQEPGEVASWRARLNLPAEAPLILHVGRLDADKQVEKVLQAAAMVMQETPVHLLVVGEGSKKAELEQLSEVLGIRDKTHFTGYITIAEGLPAVYRLGSLFITASQVEAQGLVLLEAAASGLPIVAVRATSIPESVHHGETGLLAPDSRPENLAEAMLQLIKDPALSTRMGQAGRDLARSHSLEQTFDRYEELYQTWIGPQI